MEKISRYDECKNCKHKFITSFVETNLNNGEKEVYFGCVKCGVDESILRIVDYADLTPEEQDEVNYLRSEDMYHRDDVTFDEDTVCHLPLAMAIYSRIKERKPRIDDEKAFTYFKRALAYMRRNNTEERKVGRIKRLSLENKVALFTPEEISTEIE